MAAEKEMGKNEWYTRERIRKEDASAVGWGGPGRTRGLRTIAGSHKNPTTHARPAECSAGVPGINITQK